MTDTRLRPGSPKDLLSRWAILRFGDTLPVREPVAVVRRRVPRLPECPMRFIPLVCLLPVVLAGCGADDDAGTDAAAVPDAVDSDAAGEAVDAATDVAAELGVHDSGDGDGSGFEGPLLIDETSFGCITDGVPVRRFYVTSLLGDATEAVAIANGEAEGPYPPGTVIQLVPQEAMVKREPGFAPEANDWEFFFLNIDANGTEIAARGVTEVQNAFGGNCFGCHADAAASDFICETTNGCVDLPLTEALIRSLQTGDQRCVD